VPSCQLRILDFNYFFQETTILTASSEDVNFPASNLRKRFRSRVARTTGTFVIDSTNNKVNFKESGAGPELTATLTVDSYTPSGLATEIKTQLEAAGAETYTVTFSTTNGKWTIASGGAFLSILWLSGTDTATNVGTSIGFDITSDDVGSTSYTGAFIAIHTEETWKLDLLSPQIVDSLQMFWDDKTAINLSDQAVITLQGNATDVFTAPSVDQIVTLNNTFKIASHYFATDQNLRFWRIKIVDPSNTNLHIEVGTIILAKAKTLTRKPSTGFTFKIRDRSRIMNNAYGNTYADRVPKRKRLEFQHVFFEDADFDTLITVYNNVGNNDYLGIVFDPLGVVFDKDKFATYGVLTAQLNVKNNVKQFFTSPFAVEERF